MFRLRRRGRRRPSPVTFGTIGATAVPVVGDWDGDGRDTVGIYQRGKAKFELSGPDLKRPTRGATASSRRARGPRPTCCRLAGDWNGVDVVTLDDLDAIFGPFAEEAAGRPSSRC